jgi:polysaccharide biosynthesis/export protein
LIWHFDPLQTILRAPAAGIGALLFAVGLAVSGPALAQSVTPPGKVSPAAPVVADPASTPLTAPLVTRITDVPQALPGEFSAPIAPDAPRVAKLPAGDVPADDYRIGPQDLIEIQVFGIENLKREVRVNSRGVISLPLIGTVALGGLTGQEAEALIAMKYAKDYLQDPQVSVFIKEFTSQRITLAGAVAKPGIYPMRGQTTLVQAIAIAGGAGSLADMTEVMVYRRDGNDKKIMTFDIEKIRVGEMEDPSLVNEDVVVVKRSPGRVALRDSILGDIINIFNPLNYLPRY